MASISSMKPMAPPSWRAALRSALKKARILRAVMPYHIDWKLVADTNRNGTPAWRAMMAEQVVRARGLYAEAEEGLPLLPPASRRCVGTALVLYSRILDRIEAADQDVFGGRIRVPDAEKLAVALRSVTVGVPRR